MPTFTIGREINCDVPIADDSVSRVHAEIWLSPDGALMLADRGSSNGTELIRAGEASPLSKTAVLPGDQVRFGGVTLTVKDLIDAIQAKSPGALTGPRVAEATPPKVPASPPPLPPIPDHPKASPPVAPPPLERAVAQSPPPPPKPNVAPPRLASPPPLPPIPATPQAQRQVAPPPPPPPLPSIPAHPPAFHPVTPPERAAGPAAGPVVRCECGAIKTQGQVCAACHR